jgi:hypothetical protein
LGIHHRKAYTPAAQVLPVPHAFALDPAGALP